MTQFSDQTDLHTDAFPMAQSITRAKSGLNSNQKKVLGISAAAMLLGGTAWTIAQKIKEQGTEHGPMIDGAGLAKPTPTPPVSPLPSDVDVAGKVTDAMSFDEAFETARNEVGMGGVFGWHGHWYNTFEKAEWSSLSLEQRIEYTEMVSGEKLPVQSYSSQVDHGSKTPVPVSAQPVEPTLIEGYLNGQRVMGLDIDHDGIIDTLVLEGEDGHTYRVVDASGDEGLDTVYRYDSLDGELFGVVRPDQPFILSNNQFSEGLEESMSREVVDSVLDPEVSVPVDPTPVPAMGDHSVDSFDEDILYLADSHEPEDDTYVNDGDVRDMED